MPIPLQPILPSNAYLSVLSDTLSSNIPYTLTDAANAETPSYPVCFPGQNHPGILPDADIPICPPIEYFAENVNNLIILEENCAAPLQYPENCGIL